MITATAFEEFEKALEEYKDAEPMPWEEYKGITTKRCAKHARFVASFIPGYRSFVIDTDVEFMIWGKVLREGVYHVLDPDTEEQEEQNGKWWVFASIPDESDSADHSDNEAPLRMKMEVQTVHDGEPLTFAELFTWIAINDLIDEGDSVKAARLFLTAYADGDEDQSSPQMPPLTSIKPRTHYIPIGKDSQFLTDPALFEPGGLSLDVGRKKGQTYIQFALTAPEGVLRTADGKPFHLDRTDKDIISAVVSLKEAAEAGASAAVVNSYNILVEMGVDRPEPNRCADIDMRVKRMTSTPVHLDLSAEARERKMVSADTGEAVDRYVISNISLIPAIVHEMTDERGNVVIRYELTDYPPTYKHAKDTKQVARHPSKLLHLAPVKESGEKIRRASTERQINIKNYLLERIFSTKSKKSSISSTIRYDTLCTIVGIDPDNRSAKKRVADYAEAYLRALQSEGVILDFRIRQEGRRHTKTAVEVFVKQS